MNETQKLKETIAVLEMEVGFLRTVRKSPNPMHSIVAGEIELNRQSELTAMKQRLQELEMAA